ncbi:segregation and condensation protein A [Peribacillus deserti]|uniref:Segregation and condensation protein A n=1 Tax=Peribacillus deserti TaxID=673318 RepID=A0ABS2QJ41_9BACI|nr:segregation/condensation protein A [Peribacillus deserti]MBM7693170.1 segregation and condensation protein A [Peribacillus deserti]
MIYNVKTEAFEGPLDLLLHLINRLEIDIYDIPVADITDQYLNYIHAMKELELDVASEYLVMAATLLAIKSQMLLPKYEEQNFEADESYDIESDPRDELVEKLLEYRSFKNAAGQFKQLEQDRGLVFTKPPSDLSEFSAGAEMEKQELDVSLYDMLGALQKLLRRKKLQKPVYARIEKQEISIESRMKDIMGFLHKRKGRVSFFDLFPIPEKPHIVVTFLSLLELMKQKNIHVEQENNFSEIFVAAKVGVDTLGS